MMSHADGEEFTPDWYPKDFDHHTHSVLHTLPVRPTSRDTGSLYTLRRSKRAETHAMVSTTEKEKVENYDNFGNFTNLANAKNQFYLKFVEISNEFIKNR